MNAPEQNPFISKDVFCPICLLPTRQTRVKRHLYLEQNLDIDSRPSSYVWKAKGLDHLFPQLYYMWHCPHCLFTAGAQVFEDPTQNLSLTLEQTRSAYVRATRDEPGVDKMLTLLSTGVTPGGPWDHQQAIRLHWLAIYALHLLAKHTSSPDYLNMARYSLRLAWLWRDLDDDPNLAAAFRATLEKVAQVIGGLWPFLPYGDLASSMEAAKYYQNLLDQPDMIEKLGDPGEIHLLIARIHIQHRGLDNARQHWSLAWDMAQRHEMARKKLETNLYQLRDKSRNAAPALVPRIKAKLEEMGADLIKVENAGRNLRNKSSQVRDLLDDLLAELNPQPKSSETPAKKKGLRGIFG